MIDRECLELPDGYSKIVHGIAEALARTNLPGECSRILWVIFRKTYGFDKKADRIALSQFVEYTGMAKANCQRALKKLISRNIIKCENGVYSFNKYSDQWGTPIGSPMGLQSEAPQGDSNRSTGGLQSEYKRDSNRKPTIENRNITIESSSSILQSEAPPEEHKVRKVYELLYYSDWRHLVSDGTAMKWVRSLVGEVGAVKAESGVVAIIEFYKGRGIPIPNRMNGRVKVFDWCRTQREQKETTDQMIERIYGETGTN